MAGLLDIELEPSALVRTSGRVRHVRHADLSFAVQTADTVGLVVNLSGSHQVEGGATGRFWSGTPRPGSSSVLPPGPRHEFRIRGTCSVLLMQLPLKQLAAMVGLDVSAARIKPVINSDDVVLTRLMIDMAMHGSDRDVVSLIAEHLLIRQAVDLDPRPPAHLPKARLRRVTEMIAADPVADLPLSMLAREAGMSPYAFSRGFKAATGTSPHRYVLRRRLELAIELLSKSRLPVMDVARSSGFSHVSHLARHMRQWTGTTPHLFRSRILP